MEMPNNQKGSIMDMCFFRLCMPKRNNTGTTTKGNNRIHPGTRWKIRPMLLVVVVVGR